LKISKTLKESGRSLSFEFFPPKEAAGEITLFDTISKLKTLNPTFVSVTYGAGGSTSKNTERTVTRIINEYGITAMPHMTLVNQSRETLKSMLQDYSREGVENVLALRGDPPAGKAVAASQDKDFKYAADLVKLAKSLGNYSIAVAVYPEGHVEAPSIEKDIEYTKMKVDQGAEFAITQMFFDNRAFYIYLDKVRKAGINIPIIPGILPVTDVNKVQEFAARCGASLPQEIIDRFSTARAPGEMRKIGLETTTDQCVDLVKNGISYFHFYSLNRAEAVTEIIDSAGLRKFAQPSADNTEKGECLSGKH
jgi:methylenetetrahydrofolate reductase (NADPH)